MTHAIITLTLLTLSSAMTGYCIASLVNLRKIRKCSDKTRSLIDEMIAAAPKDSENYRELSSRIDGRLSVTGELLGLR